MIRAATIDDLPFVRSAWLRSYASSDWATLVSPGERYTSTCNRCGKASLRATRSGAGLTLRRPSEVYWSGQRALIDRLIRSAAVIVAQGADNLLDGFICFEPPDVLHYVYVRNLPTLRGTGIAKELCSLLTGPVRYTHRSRQVDEARVPAGWVFSPYLLMGVRDAA